MTKAVFDSVYDSFGYAAALNYTQKLKPPLSPEENAWVEARLRKEGRGPRE